MVKPDVKHSTPLSHPPRQLPSLTMSSSIPQITMPTSSFPSMPLAMTFAKPTENSPSNTTPIGTAEEKVKWWPSFRRFKLPVRSC